VTTRLSDEVLEELLTLDAIVSETRRSRFADDRVDCTTLGQDLQQVLGSRSVLDQATGLLMTGLGYGAVEAFILLRRASEDSEQTVGVVAQGMVDAEARSRKAWSLPAGHRRTTPQQQESA